MDKMISPHCLTTLYQKINLKIVVRFMTKKILHYLQNRLKHKIKETIHMKEQEEYI